MSDTSAEAKKAAAEAGTEMTGAEMVIDALADQGVDHGFGYPGGAVLPIYDALFQQNCVRHILVRHEQGAVHAAEGYARSTGKVGVVLVTSGPGATNAVTGLTDALMDSIPLVCMTGQVPTASDRQRRLSGMRHGRHHAAVHQVQLPGQERRRPAARSARGVSCREQRAAGPGGGRYPEGRAVRQGPLCQADANSSTRAIGRGPRPMLDQIEQAVEMMAAGQAADVLYRRRRHQFGPGGARKLRELVELTGFPITSTLMGLGAFPAADPQWLGMLGMHGT